MAELNEAVVETIEETAAELTEATIARLEIKARGFLWLGVGIGLVAGCAIGYSVARKRLETKYKDLAEQEIDEMREHFRARMIAKEEKPPLAEEHRKVVENLGYQTAEEAGPGSLNTGASAEVATEGIARDLQIKPATHNIFEDTRKNPEDDWDYEVELAGRSPEAPYVIHYDEQHEKGYDEVTLTYYEGDDVLCNEKDEILDNQEEIVGLFNLNKFGHGSHDRNVVHIRNDVLQLELEVCRSPNTYAEEVHGLSHEDRPRRRRHE